MEGILKKILFYLGFLMFPLALLESHYFYGVFDLDKSLCLFLMCLGCLFFIPELCAKIKEISEDEIKQMREKNNQIAYIKRTICLMSFGAIICFVFSFKFLPYFDV